MSATKPSLDYSSMRANLDAFVADESRAWDLAAKFGPCWYRDMRAQVYAWATRYAYDAHAIAGGVAVLSATMGWEQNKSAMVRILDAYYNGARGKALPGVSRNFLPVLKVEAMLQGADPNATIVKRGKAHAQSWKTLCFYYNIIGRSSRRVTVDVHMWRILSGDYTSQHRPEGREYMLAERVIRDYAREQGMRPADMQAYLWVALTGKAE